MCCKPQIFLSNLKFHYKRCIGHRPEKGVKRLTWLEINWSVFCLNQYIVPEFIVKWREFIIGLFSPVLRYVIIVNECPPHNNSTMRRKGIR
ncbi:hypothetical protein ES708_23775 [subsurface metagenome]